MMKKTYSYALIIGPKIHSINMDFICLNLYFLNTILQNLLQLYLTNNYNVRFHPNLYRNGKCCLSILNT